MMDTPFGRVTEQGPDWFLMAREACGGGTPDLGFFLEVWGFIGGVGAGFMSGGPTWSPRQESNEEGTRQGVRPPPSRAPRGSPDVFLPPIYTHIP